MRLAVHVPGCARQLEVGIAVTSRVGALVEAMAQLADQTTIIGYEPPDNPSLEDRTDYLIRHGAAPLQFLSLGPRGTWRGYVSRRRRVADIVAEKVGEWDLMFMPLVNRRVGLVARASPGVRWVFHIGGHSPTVVRQSSDGLRRAKRWALAMAAEASYVRHGRRGLFLANAETLIEHYKRWIPSVELVRTSVRSECFQHRSEDRLATDTPKVVIYGRLAEAKGVHDAMEAFSRFKARVPGAELHVLGTGPAEAAMRSQADQLGIAGATTWHGWMPPGPELFGVLEQMDLLITLSRAEALPNAVPEAMAHSVLVVSTAVGALPAAFESERHLLFVPERDPAAAAAAMLRLRTDRDLRRRLLDAGFRSALPLSVEAVAARILDLASERWPELELSK